MSIFEIGMLICFGAAWPVSIMKSIKSKSTQGKSLIFLIVIFLGYVLGTLHKVFFSYDGVIFLYSINLLMVGTDILLYLRNKRLEKQK